MADTSRLEDLPVNQPEGADVGEGGVRRQTGPDLPTIHRADPIANAPVIQVDPDVHITRQTGVFVQDAGSGVYRMDTPVPDEVAGQMQLTDRRLRDDEDQVVPGVSVQQAPSLHSYGPVAQVSDTHVTRQGDDPEFTPPSDVQRTDEPLAADHPTGVVMQEGPPSTLAEEQLQEFRQDKPYKGDRTMTPEEVQQQQAQMREALGMADQVESPSDRVQARRDLETADEAQDQGTEQGETVRQKEDPKGKRKRATVTEED